MTAQTDYSLTLWDRFMALMGAIRWTVHYYRGKHERNQAFALAMLEAAESHHRQHERYERDGNPLAEKMEGLSELMAVRRAVNALEACGCPSFAWDEVVYEKAVTYKDEAHHRVKREQG